MAAVVERMAVGARAFLVRGSGFAESHQRRATGSGQALADEASERTSETGGYDDDAAAAATAAVAAGGRSEKQSGSVGDYDALETIARRVQPGRRRVEVWDGNGACVVEW